MFARDMNWRDDLTLENASLRRCQLQLAMYAKHLATGSTILCRQVKSATIKNYVRDVASFLALFGNHPRDIRKDNPTDTKLSHILNSVFAELKRWEDVPNRREPFTLEMLTEVKNMAAAAKSGPDTLLAALSDWFECGLFAGLRLTEHGQPAHCTDPRYPLLNKRMETKAFCLRDIRFETITKSRLSATAAIRAPNHLVCKCWIKFRTQKNGSHGEERLYTQNPNQNGLCFVRGMLRIVNRFVRLHGTDSHNTPLSTYRNTESGPPQLITSNNIDKIMRQAAATVYNLDPIKHKKELQRWSSHSLRVGACVILHSMGYTETQIKWLLRWRSDAFMVYLRNLAILSNKQNTTLDDAAAMPHFL
jgi:hypothetical protein